MTERRRRALRRPDRRARRRRAVVAELERERRCSRGREPYTHTVPVLAPLGRADRAADLAAVVHAHGRARRGRRSTAVRDGRVRFHPDRWARVYLDWMENIRPWCISRQLWWGHRLPVWYCDAARRPTSAPSRALRRRRLGAGPRRARHLVLERAVAVRDARLARADTPSCAPSTRPTSLVTGARHHLPVGRADDHDGARVHRRGPVRRRLRALGDPGARRAADVQVARHRHRPARRDRRRAAPPVFAEAATSRHGADAVRFGLLAMSSGQDVRFSEEKVAQGAAARQQALERRALDPARGSSPRRRAARAAGTVEDRWILSRLERASSARSARGSSATSSRTPRWRSTTSSTASCATGTWSWSSRACATASPTLRATLLHVLHRDARARAPDHAVRDRGDLRARPGRRGACSPRACAAGARAAHRRAPPRRAVERVIEAVQAVRALARRWPASSRARRSPRGSSADGYERDARRCWRGWRASSSRDGAGRRRRSAATSRSRAARRDPRRASTSTSTRRAPARASAREARRRDRARRAQARQRGLRRQGAGGGRRRPSARSSRELERRAGGAVTPAEPARRWTPERGRALPAVARALRHALRPRPHAPADDRARASRAPLRVDPRRRHQRQVLDDADDRGDARRATGCAPAPTSRRTWSRYRERIRIGERDIAPAAFAAAVERALPGRRAGRPLARRRRRGDAVRAADRRGATPSWRAPRSTWR